MKSSSLLLLGIGSSSLYSTTMATSTSEQIHIALAGETGMRVTWFSQDNLINPGCIYGTSSETLSSTSQASSEIYLPSYGVHHKALLANLLQGSEYFYSCGDLGVDMSDVYSFHTPPKIENVEPLRFAIFGDMGWENSTTRPMGILGTKTMSGNWSASYSFELLKSMMNNNEIDMLWHVGDVGYADDACFHTIKTALQFEYEKAYNGFMNWISPLTTHLPYHVVVGNHEAECHDPLCILKYKELGLPLSNFTAYNARWAMPSKESGGVENMWYSWDYGPIHFLSIDTSTDFPDAPEQVKGGSHVFEAGYFGTDGQYMQWVEDDLKAAASNSNIRWIIAGGHRPFNGGFDYTQLEDLFHQYGVVFYFAGHSHSYSRFLSSDHANTTHIVVGGAGCEEMTFHESNPTPGYHTNATCHEWSTRLVKGELKNDESVCANAEFFTDAYAIGKLTALNGGWGDLQWELLSSITGEVIDYVTIPAEKFPKKKI